jgi:hypothetical protein
MIILTILEISYVIVYAVTVSTPLISDGIVLRFQVLAGEN